MNIVYWKPEPPEPPPANAAAIDANRETIIELRGQMLDTERLWEQVRAVVVAINKFLLRCRVWNFDTWLYRVIRDVLSEYADSLEQRLWQIERERRLAYVTRDRLWSGVVITQRTIPAIA